MSPKGAVRRGCDWGRHRHAPWLGLCVLVLAQLPTAPFGSKLEGILPLEKDFAVYVGKFCFDFNPDMKETIGEIKITVQRDGPKMPPGNLSFIIFDDEHKHWKRIRKTWTTSTCEEKRKDSSLITDIDLRSNAKGEYNIKIHEHLRPRQWYFSFVACNGLDLSGSSAMFIRYEVHAVNSQWGWQQEFSLDHMGLYYSYVVFAGCFAVMGLASWGCSRSQVGANHAALAEHPYIQLLLLAFGSSALSCVFFLVHYHFFISNGYGSMRIRFLGILAGIVSNCTMYLLAILCACGWGVTKYKLPHRSIYLGLVASIGCLHMLCELHAELIADQSTQLYMYDGFAGVIMLMLKIFMFCWFAFQSKVSYEEEVAEYRRSFYKVLGVSVSIWFLSIPVTVILSFQIASWVRFKVVTIVDLMCRFLGLCVFSHLFFGASSPITSENTFPTQDVDLDEPGTYRLNYNS